MRLSKVENIEDVYQVLSETKVNPYVGTHPHHIISANFPDVKDVPQSYLDILTLIDGDGFLAGGSVRALVTKNYNATDFDVYSYTLDGRERLVKTFLDDGYVALNYNSNCVTLEKNKIQVQVIFSFVGTIEQVLDEFDFTICRIGTDGLVVYKDKDFDSNVERKLIRIKTIQCPIGAVRRIIKYAKKGFFITNFQIFKIYQDFIKRPTTYHADLEKLLKEQDDGTITPDEMQELYNLLKRVD